MKLTPNRSVPNVVVLKEVSAVVVFLGRVADIAFLLKEKVNFQKPSSKD
ncbi:MAG: hypothetical protein ACM3MD_10895 [Betaproteobacteria bacterium]